MKWGPEGISAQLKETIATAVFLIVTETNMLYLNMQNIHPLAEWVFKHKKSDPATKPDSLRQALRVAPHHYREGTVSYIMCFDSKEQFTR